MNFIDLCAGIGGIRLGLEQAGHTCVGFCEFDKFALQSYKAIHNTEGDWEAHDITKVTDDDIRDLAATRTIDIVCGGFPCQAFSVAGKKLGFADTRGTIFFEICRFIRIIKPQYFICENVKGLLSHNSGETFAVILSALAELGYSVEWQILNSKDYGVPQNRERVFLVGHFGDGSRGKVFPLSPANGENPCKMQEITQSVGDAYRIYDGAGISRAIKSTDGGQGAGTGLYAIDLSYKNAQITKNARCLQARYNKGPCNREGETTGVLIVPVATSDYAGKNQNGQRIKAASEEMFSLTAQVPHDVAIVQRGHGFNAGGEHDIAPALTCSSYHENNMVKVSGLYANCRDDFYHGPLEGLSRTLKSSKHDAAVTDGVCIRKLTPRECWRLQGFPDEYFDRAKAAGVSDTQLYKQAGNAVTVNVARVIGERLKEIEGD